MPRPEKVQAVAEIKERLESAQAVFLAEFSGLSVKEQQELRRGLRDNGAEFKVVKMTLARRAVDELGINDLEELLVGPTGLAFAQGDPVAAAKTLADFAKAHEVFRIKGGLLGRDFLTPERVGELAMIEPRDVLLGRMAGAFQAPMAKMAGLLAALPRNLATALQQLVDKLEEEGAAGAPAASTEPAGEESEAEAPAPEAGGEPADTDAATDTETDNDDPDETTAETAEEE